MITNEIIKYEQQFEEIRGIITMHREKALRDVNEESLQMSWTVGRIVSERLKSNEWGSNKDTIVQTVSAQLTREFNSK
jgi:hypothetical protein